MVNTVTSSASQPKISAAGSAYVTGVAILANPRRILNSKTIVFDAQFYLGPTDQDFLMGSLRYFNSFDSGFEDEPELYYVNASFALRGSIADVPLSGNRTLRDYAFVGDIQSASENMIVPLGAPRFLEGLPHRSPSEDDDSRTFMINPCIQPCIHVTGVAVERSKEGAMFEITVEQYVSCVKSDPPAKKGVNRLKPTTSFLCHIPDSAKFKSWNGKPMPGNKRYVSVCGFLTGAERSGSHSEVEQFLIDVENVTFCGYYVQPANSPAIASSSSPGTSTALFSYRTPQSPPQTRQRRNQDGA